MNEPCAATTESILGRAKRFEIAMWSFLATMSLGLGYALFMGASFFPALRQAELQFAELDQAGDVAGFAPFVNEVIATWPERLAVFPATRVELVTIVLVFVLGMGAFRLVRTSPKGDPLLEISPNSELLRQRVQRALELAESRASLFVRTDGVEDAVCHKNAVYLPVNFTQKLYRKFLKNTPEQLAFLIVHEKMHGSNSDNLLWSWGRSLVFLITAISSTLMASPMLLATVAIFPTYLLNNLPFSLCIGLAISFVAVLLAFIGTVTNGVLPNLAVAREFFADALPAYTPGIGPQSLPYEGTTDVERRGDVAAGWSMTVFGPDRRLHAGGIAPRTGALAASTLAMWVLVRTLILMLDPMAWCGVVRIFDAAYLIEIAIMLYTLPRRRIGARSYGLLSWVTTIILSGLIASSFALMDMFFINHGITSIAKPLWLADISIPPFVVAAGILLWDRATALPRRDLEDIDRLPPRRMEVGPVVELVGAAPSYIWSHAMGGVALLTCSTTLTAWCFGNFSFVLSFVIDAIFLLLCAGLAVVVVKNFRAPRPWSIAAEVIAGVIMFVLIAYWNMCIRLAAARMPPENSGPPFDFHLFINIMLSPPADLAIITFSIAGIVVSVLLISWVMRYCLLTHGSFFRLLKEWLVSDRQPVGFKNQETPAS